jgi:hypothetical protein
MKTLVLACIIFLLACAPKKNDASEIIKPEPRHELIELPDEEDFEGLPEAGGEDTGEVIDETN